LLDFRKIGFGVGEKLGIESEGAPSNSIGLRRYRDAKQPTIHIASSRNNQGETLGRGILGLAFLARSQRPWSLSRKSKTTSKAKAQTSTAGG
jgi:hypothetical protein